MPADPRVQGRLFAPAWRARLEALAVLVMSIAQAEAEASGIQTLIAAIGEVFRSLKLVKHVCIRDSLAVVVSPMGLPLAGYVHTKVDLKRISNFFVWANSRTFLSLSDSIRTAT